MKLVSSKFIGKMNGVLVYEAQFIKQRFFRKSIVVDVILHKPITFNGTVAAFALDIKGKVYSDVELNNQLLHQYTINKVEESAIDFLSNDNWDF